MVTVSSQQRSSYTAFKAFRFGNTEWATGSETSDFWIKVRCLEEVKVCKFVLAGRRNDSSEQIHNWKFEGSNDNSDWAIIHSETSYPIDSSIHQFNVENNTILSILQGGPKK